MCGPVGDGQRDDAAFEKHHGYDPRGPETPRCPVVIPAQSGGQTAEVLRDLNRVKAEFQLRAICAHMGIPR